MQIDIFELLEPKQENNRWVRKGDNQWQETRCALCKNWISVGQGMVFTNDNKELHTKCINKLPIEQIQKVFRHYHKGQN